MTVYVKGKNSAGRWQTDPEYASSNTWTVHVASNAVALSEAPDRPRDYQLKQNLPNPFNPMTEIEFELPQSSDVRLDILDALGRRVATLVSGRVAAGRHKTMWSAEGFPAGMYFACFRAGDFTRTIRMSLVK